MSELYDKMFTRSEKEEAIWQKIEEERERFKNTVEYKEHDKKMNALFKEESDAHKKRIIEAKEYRTKRFSRKETVETDEEKTQRLSETKKKHAEKFASYPEVLQHAIKAYEALSEDAKRVFERETWCYHNELSEMKNKQITEEQTRQLHYILVQTCIDFINEEGLKDVDAVSFSADALQESAKYNEWTSATDSFLTLEGVEKSEEDGGFFVRKLINKSY